MQRSLDLTDKRDACARHGLAHLWLVDPKPRTLEAFTLREGGWVLVAASKDADEVRVPPFRGGGVPVVGAPGGAGLRAAERSAGEAGASGP